MALILLSLILFVSMYTIDARADSSSIQLGDSCVDVGCHTAFRESQFVHSPVLLEHCSMCHETVEDRHVFRLTNTGEEMCTMCHKMKFQSSLHEPVTKGECLKCHDSHSADNPMLLLMDQPEMCYDCHQDIAQIVETSSYIHEGALQEKRCSNCHAAHASSYPGLLVNHSYDLCLFCHDQEIKRPDGTAIENIGKLIEENPYRHGPVVQKNCVACHDPHGSAEFSLLVSPYPKKFYAPFDLAEYDLCFKCHSQEIFLEERTTTSTNFRDGDRNLHFLHVNKEDKGRTCRACHETHASSQKAHIRSAVPYGDWEFPLVFESDDNGGTCLSGCHEEQSYSRQYQPVEVLKPLALD